MQELEITIKAIKKEDGTFETSFTMPLDATMVHITNVLVAGIEELQKVVEKYISEVKFEGSDEEIRAFIRQISVGQISAHSIKNANAESQKPQAKG